MQLRRPIVCLVIIFAIGLLIVVLLVAECHAETKQEVRLGRSPSLQRTSTALATQQSVPGPRTLLAAIFFFFFFFFFVIFPWSERHTCPFFIIIFRSFTVHAPTPSNFQLSNSNNCQVHSNETNHLK